LPRQIRESKQKASVNSRVNILSYVLIKAAVYKLCWTEVQKLIYLVMWKSIVIKKSGHNCNNFKVYL